jgi:hypothetical protein
VLYVSLQVEQLTVRSILLALIVLFVSSQVEQLTVLSIRLALIVLFVFSQVEQLTELSILLALIVLYVSSQVEQLTVLSILLALIVLGNLTILVTLYLKKTKSRMNFFIMQLAGAGECRFSRQIPLSVLPPPLLKLSLRDNTLFCVTHEEIQDLKHNALC